MTNLRFVFDEVAVSSKLAKAEEAEQLLSVTMIDVIESEEDLSISAVTIEPKVEANAPHKDYRVSSNEVSIYYKDVKLICVLWSQYLLCMFSVLPFSVRVSYIYIYIYNFY